MQGSTIAVYANGNKLTEVTDNTYAEGRYGLYVAANDTANFTYRAVKLAYWLINPTK
jgi:hypothetical protein